MSANSRYCQILGVFQLGIGSGGEESKDAKCVSTGSVLLVLVSTITKISVVMQQIISDCGVTWEKLSTTSYRQASLKLGGTLTPRNMAF
nr:hypothetical transcript [Hymenolepis microstoma]